MSTPISKLRKATITNYDAKRGIITAKIDTSSQTLPIGKQTEKTVQIPFSFYSVEGLFLGGRPKVGTPIIIGEGEGTNWYFVSFNVANVPQIPDLVDGQLLAQVNNNTRLSLINNTIDIGSKSVNLHLNTTGKKTDNKFQSTFSNQLSFTEASRQITGIVKREIKLDSTPSQLKLTNEDYDNNLTPISLDPAFPTLLFSNDDSKNPPFVEKRELLYEFAHSSNVTDDITEASIYSSDQQSSKLPSKFVLPNRRQSKADTLSLSLVAPNFLMESVKGTVVDIFGNVLDLNRHPIVGANLDKPDLSLNTKSEKDKAFDKIRAAERKSVAFHFEINARKDLTGKNGKLQLPDINSTTDYARQRSRFFVDIDKEGQFKINVPASSEVGNIPLHVRYENYSTFGTEDNGNPNKLIFNENSLDIFPDSFAIGDIEIKDENSVISPIDRITKQHIKHGMPYHSIANSVKVFQSDVAEDFLNYQTVFKPVDISKIPSVDKIVSPVITVSGPNANAGGRSGSFHADGSMEVSLGANTIDRQSLWADLAGGFVANVGRDKNFVSGAISLDGDLLVQIGGYGVSGDTRFKGLNDAFRAGALDIRVINEGFTVTMLRIDKNGVTVMTPNTITYSARKIVMKAIEMDFEADRFLVNKRMINKFPVVTI